MLYRLLANATATSALLVYNPCNHSQKTTKRPYGRLCGK